MTTPIIYPERSMPVIPEDWSVLHGGSTGYLDDRIPERSDDALMIWHRIAPPTRPHISDPAPPAGWPDLRLTVADIAAGALLLVCMLIGAIGIVLASFWILSAFYDLVLKHIIEG